MACKSQKVSVRYLLMALQLLWNGLKSRRNGEILDPEFVLWMCNVGGKEKNCIRRRQRVTRELRIADQPDQPELRQRAGGPMRFTSRSEPPMRGFVVFVRRPQEGREDVQIEEC
ncbi:MAG: hypothetical protein QOE82_1467 [Thermoanaerobaculia bacterium]|nr:hypothetical protein [Thermoanaerobaculia bacterium]